MPVLILKVQYFPLSDGKLCRISGGQPQLRWWSRWPPDLNLGTGHYLSPGGGQIRGGGVRKNLEPGKGGSEVSLC